MTVIAIHAALKPETFDEGTHERRADDGPERASRQRSGIGPHRGREGSEGGRGC